MSSNSSQIPSEVRQIARLFNFWDTREFEFFDIALRRHGKLSHRIQLALQDYFKEEDLQVNEESLLKDAQSMHMIFPEYSTEYIADLFRQLGSERDRFRLVARQLLIKNGNALKRSHDRLPVCSSLEKKLRIISATEAEVVPASKETSYNLPKREKAVPVSTENCESTTEHEFNNGDKITEIDQIVEETASRSDLLPTSTHSPLEQSFSRPEFDLRTEENRLSDQPIQSFENSESTLEYEFTGGNEMTEIDQIVEEAAPQSTSLSTITPSHLHFEASIVDRNIQEIYTNELSSVVKGEHSYNCTYYNSSDTAGGGDLGIQNRGTAPVEYGQHESVGNYNTDTAGGAYNIIPASSEPIASCSSSNGGYDLYGQLMLIFTKADKETIKRICAHYGVNPNKKPPEPVYTAIVNELLKSLPSSGSAVNRTFQSAAPVNIDTDLNKEESQDIQENEFDNDPVFNKILSDLMDDNSNTNMTPDVVDVDEYDIEERMPEGNSLLSPLMEMFPEACPRFLRRLCRGKNNSPGVLDDLISTILESEYPKRKKSSSPEQKMTAEQQLEMIKQILPEADPNYLEMHCDRLADKEEELKVFIEEAVETRNYPTMKDYLRRQQISSQQKQYTTEFDVANFLEIIPDPVSYFEGRNQKWAPIVELESQHYVLCFYRRHFSKIPVRIIRDVFKKTDFNFMKTYKSLQKTTHTQLKSKRIDSYVPEPIQNIPLLQQIAYVEHKADILNYLEQQKIKDQKEKEEARIAGLLQTCGCCFDEEVMLKDIYHCENGCAFCKECIQKGAEVSYGDGKLDFACLGNCSSHFSLQTLQAVLKPKMFSKVAQKKQLEEVKAAGIEDLETCPFCDFATIPAREDKLFRCLNPECMKESCRLCKEPSHLPLRCEEVEKENDIKTRTYIENKMSEALIRKCYKCGLKFIKADGCNKMTCSCGALMCYICGKPVKDYKHFNGPGGDEYQKCPLYSDTNHLHETAVLKGAEDAKREIGVIEDPSKLKIDPTADVQKHYKEISHRNPSIVPPGFENNYGYPAHAAPAHAAPAHAAPAYAAPVHAAPARAAPARAAAVRGPPPYHHLIVGRYMLAEEPGIYHGIVRVEHGRHHRHHHHHHPHRQNPHNR